MADDATSAVIGMVPVVMATSVLQKTMDANFKKKKKLATPTGFGLFKKKV